MTFRGARAPEQLAIVVRHPRGPGRIALDFVARTDEWRLERDGLVWQRRGPETTITRGAGPVRVPGGGSDVQRLLMHFRAVAVDGAPTRAGAALGITTLRLVRTIIERLEAEGAPFDASEGPRHASSPQLAAFPRAR